MLSTHGEFALQLCCCVCKGQFIGYTYEEANEYMRYLGCIEAMKKGKLNRYNEIDTVVYGIQTVPKITMSEKS